MVFDNYAEIKIGDKAYKLCLNNACAFGCERDLMSKNLLITLANQPLNSGDQFAFFKWALIGGGTVLENDDAYFKLFVQAMAELDFKQFYEAIIAAIVKSGVLGSEDNVKKMMAARPM